MGGGGEGADRWRPEELDEADRPPADDYCWVSAIRWDRLIGGDPRSERCSGKSQQVLRQQNKQFALYYLIYYLT